MKYLLAIALLWGMYKLQGLAWKMIGFLLALVLLLIIFE